MRTKQCSGCSEHLPLESFGSDKRASSGLRSSCRACTSARAREARGKATAARPAHDFRPEPTATRCPYCRKTLEPSAFGRSAASASGLQTYCKPCTKFLYPDTRQGRVRPGRYRRSQDDRPNDGQHENKP